jgi:alanine racemase
VAEISLDAIVENAAVLRRHVGPAVGLYAVVKADGYGHGAVAVAHALEAAGVDLLAVSLVDEGLELRAAGLSGRIVVMGGDYGAAHSELLAAGLEPIVCEPSDLAQFRRAARVAGRAVSVHLGVDTGMARLGVDPAGFAPLLATALEGAHREELRVVGIATHLATADERDDSGVRLQLEAFGPVLDAVATHWPPAAVGRPAIHVANSAATLRLPVAHFDAVRPGLALYGIAPDGLPREAEPARSLRPAMQLTSRIIALRTIQPGAGVSYGWKFRAARTTTVATVPVGYADGYPRRASAQAQVLVAGRRCRVLGVVCMDMLMVDVTELMGRTAVGSGTPVVLLGAQDDERISVEEMAHWAGVIPYEIICGISKRVPRVYTPRRP